MTTGQARRAGSGAPGAVAPAERLTTSPGTIAGIATTTPPSSPSTSVVPVPIPTMTETPPLVPVLVSAPADNTPQISTTTYGSLQFTLRIEKKVYTRSEPIPATFTVTNTGPEAISYDISQPGFDSQVTSGNGLGPALHVQFAADVGDMFLHRAQAQHQVTSDLTIGGPCSQPLQHLAFASGVRLHQRR